MTIPEIERAYRERLPVKFQVVSVGMCVYDEIDALIYRRNDACLTTVSAELKDRNGTRCTYTVNAEKLFLADEKDKLALKQNGGRFAIVEQGVFV